MLIRAIRIIRVIRVIMVIMVIRVIRNVAYTCLAQGANRHMLLRLYLCMTSQTDTRVNT